ncbi:MAG: SUMF1/EgtB/PvdO family nonheme iron enzyme [Deltaproteobacteria bacterium]|nr:SUMF1/EgtB/PvdO family nonheme iron enzyme [Deltaproteobacteria bacterium]
MRGSTQRPILPAVVAAALLSLQMAACIFTLEPPIDLQAQGGSSGTGGVSIDSGASAGQAGADADADSVADAAYCTPNAKRCDGGQPQLCSQAQTWVDQGPCTGGTTCIQGDCVPQNPSCDGLPAACGPAGKSHCCASAAVVGGSYQRSYDAVTYTDGSFPADVADFRLDTYEVTVGRFRKFMAGWPGNKPQAGAGAHPLVAASGWDSAWDGKLSDQATLLAALKCDTTYETWTNTPGDNETRPINCITWYEAFAFCAWDKGRLPTEAEWNYAAAGGAEQRVYPWSEPSTSTAIDPQHASYFVDATDMCMGDGTPGCTVADLIFVGAKQPGQGKWGHADLAGNVMEWVLDFYKPGYKMPCNNCAELVATGERVLRGGSYVQEPPNVLTSFRFSGTSELRRYYYGIRCARAL